MKIVAAGATGFIGGPLCAALAGAGHAVTVLTRDAARAQKTLGPGARAVAWGGGASEDWKREVREADAVVNLAGSPVAGQAWTPEYKEEVRASRVEATRAIVDAMGEGGPTILVNASAVGFYGDRGDERLTEESGPGKGFLPDVCRAWEDEAMRAEGAGARAALMRIGIVLGEGGALDKILRPLPVPVSPWSLGLGGPFGSGRQWMPWIHLDDAVGLLLWALESDAARGPVNVTAPHPATNRDFSRTLGRVLGRPALFPVPAFALRLIMGETAAVVLAGQRALPALAERAGYRFRFPQLEPALRSILKK